LGTIQAGALFRAGRDTLPYAAVLCGTAKPDVDSRIYEDTL
jgi:hypothetical protein